MNWTDFIGRFREATQAAKELQNAIDAEFEISNSIKLQKAAMAEELNSLEILMRDVSKPWEERRKAAEKYLEMVRPLYQQEIDLANKLLDAQQGKWLAGSGLADTEQTRNDLTKFLVDYGKTNNGLSDIIGRMLELQDEYDATMSMRMAKGDYLYTTKERDEYLALRDVLQNFASQNGYQTDGGSPQPFADAHHHGVPGAAAQTGGHLDALCPGHDRHAQQHDQQAQPEVFNDGKHTESVEKVVKTTHHQCAHQRAQTDGLPQQQIGALGRNFF
jgi:hypothetical protein